MDLKLTRPNARTKAGILVLLALLVFHVAVVPRLLPAEALEEPAALVPQVNELNQVASRWDFEISGYPNATELASKRMSSRLYGSERGGPALHRKLTLTSELDKDAVFGFFVESASAGGALLDIEVDGEFFHRLHWPAATPDPFDTTYWFDLPAGPRTVTLRVANSAGVITIPRYTYARSLSEIPGEEFVQLERQTPPAHHPNTFADGYQGIWHERDPDDRRRDDFSGGAGTYPSHHSPVAVHAPDVDRTFFVYGGTDGEDDPGSLVMAAVYDHASHQVSRPTVVHNHAGIDDPHANSSMAIDSDGHIWVFASGPGAGRPGFTYRSTAPHSVEQFEQVAVTGRAHPQPHWFEPGGFVNLFTKYTYIDEDTTMRQLFWATSLEGTDWAEEQLLASFGGHNQVSAAQERRLVTAFNYHPGGEADLRTNLYVVVTDTRGENWRAYGSGVIDVPLLDPDNPALAMDYAAQDRLVHLVDIALDEHGRPAVLYLTSDRSPGPESEPPTWHVTRWLGEHWDTRVVTTSDHIYDSGSLYIDGNTWTVVAPTGAGPQPDEAGGEVALWRSQDAGGAWTEVGRATTDSELNHGFVRSPTSWNEPFFALWSDGDPTAFSESRLYFGDSEGRYWMLPPDGMSDRSVPLRQCDAPDSGETVTVAGEDSGVENRASWGGCSINDVIEDDLSWRDQDAFERHVREVTDLLQEQGTIDTAEGEQIAATAGEAEIN